VQTAVVGGHRTSSKRLAEVLVCAIICPMRNVVMDGDLTFRSFIDFNCDKKNHCVLIIIFTVSQTIISFHQYIAATMNLLSSYHLLIASVTSMTMTLAQITGTYIPLAYTVSKTPECLYERITTSEHLTGEELLCTYYLLLIIFFRYSPKK
jgi:hypothetical protein